MSDSHELLKPLLDELHKSGRLRVWSIVISIFGDLVQPRGGRISMQELLALTENVGIEGNALRTAMSRLAKEEWVDRYKEGRNSFYTLSGYGKQTFLAASERIYQARFNSGSSDWVMAFYPEDLPQQTVDVASRLSFNKRIAVCSIEDKARLENGQALILDARVSAIENISTHGGKGIGRHARGDHVIPIQEVDINRLSQTRETGGIGAVGNDNDGIGR